MPYARQLSFDRLSEQIQAQSYATVPFLLPRAEFQHAIDQFVKFLTLPAEIKDSIYFQLDPSSRGSEVGYKKYRRELGHTDNREYFHYNEHADERFKETMVIYPELSSLIQSAKGIYQEAKLTLEQVVVCFEERFPGIYQQFFPTGQLPNFYLRLLKYDRMKPGEFLAKGHYDRGGCTLALAESAPGLRMGHDDTDLREVVHTDGQALFMPGITFREVTSDEYPPTWHDVVQKGEDVYSPEIARWAVVFFAGTTIKRKITYEEAHTPQY